MCELCLHQGLLLEKQQDDVTPAKSGSPSVKLIQRWEQFSHSTKICHYTQLFNLIIPKQFILVPKQEFSNVLSTHASIIGQLRITVWPWGPRINKERRIFRFHISLTVNTQTGNDHNMTDRVLVGFGHNIFNLLPEIAVVYVAYIKIYVEKIYLHQFFLFFFWNAVKFWRRGTKNASKEINQNKTLSDDGDNTVLQFLHITKGKELKYWIIIA